jgi:hypothetical protein
MNSGDSRKSFRKAFFLFLALVLVIILANGLIPFLSSPNKFTALSKPPRDANITLFNEDEKDLVKKNISGFWYCTNASCPSVPFLKISDRIELKGNGIFWQVKRTMISLPSGDSAVFLSVITGYMSPYSRIKTCADSMACQIHFIAQVSASGSDTCYEEILHPSQDSNKSVVPQILRTRQNQGEAAVDTVWDIVANGKRFEFEGRSYSPYDTSGQALYSFFPSGALKLVEKISLNKCKTGTPLESFVKQVLTADFAAMSVTARQQADILKIVDTYYKGMFAEDLAKRVAVYARGNATMSFSVTPQGKVIDPKVEKAKPWNLRVNRELKKELLTWVFPKCTSQAAPVMATFSFTY